MMILQKSPDKVLFKLMLFEINCGEKAIDSEVNRIKCGVNPHSIVEYSKENNSIGEDSIKYSIPEKGAKSVETVDNSTNTVDKISDLKIKPP